MSLAAILEALSAAGATNDMLVAAARAHEATQAAENEARLAKKRAGNAERQRRFRVAHPVVNNESNALQAVTERDERDEDDAVSPPIKSSPITPIKLTPPSTSLRSDTSAQAAMEFFNRFYAAFPRKTERKAAAKKFFEAMKSGVDPEVMIAGAIRYAASNPEPKFTKHPTTWLSKGCWEDEFLPRDGPRQERGSWMAQAATGRGYDDQQQHPGEHQSGEGSFGSKPRAFGSDRALPEPGGADGGGTLLDLRVAGASWS